MVVLIDHYDSFADMLADYLRQLGAEVRVVKTDQVSVAALEGCHVEHIVIGPGHGHPRSPALGRVYEVLEHYHTRLPILGVCLGHQILACFFGGQVTQLPEVHHGVIATLQHDGSQLFAGCPQRFVVTRYHSLRVERTALPAGVRSTASCTDTGSANGQVNMALCHEFLPLYGIQYHPEAVKSGYGLAVLQNFLRISP